MITSGIFYMGCKKKLIKKGLIDLFPKDINMFVDLFAGSGIVGMNVKANRYIVNDIDKNVFRLYKMFKDYGSEEIISKILNNINEFNLRRNSISNKSDEMPKHKQNYIKLRDKANKTKNIFDLYTCMFYSFSQQMRFNSKGDFNMPNGNNAFTQDNEIFIKDTCDYFQKACITNNDFRKLKINKLNSNDFVYIDSPYFNTDATYNENGGWTMQDDLDLFTLCEQLNNSNIKWGMSNVFNCKGKENTHLIEWCNENNWNVYNFDKFSYNACGKGNSNAKEVYICNYEI